MKLIIHRGSKEIGGTCVELQSGNSNILIDFGLPLVDENRSKFDSKKIRGKSKKELIEKGILPGIKGLYRDEELSVNAVLLSHPHQDHYGLLYHVNPKIPIYLSEGCKELIEVSHFFGQTNFDAKNANPVKSWKQFNVGSFKVKPYLVDHSGFDALAFLIEAEGKKVFYSGDFRGHGRKAVLFTNMLKRPPKGVSCLLLEGSMLGREEENRKESDVENKLVNLFNESKELFFIACSSQNIDRIVSIYKACCHSKRVFVIDPYTALILNRLKKISSNIPQFDWGKNIRIFFVQNSHTKKMAENKSLFKFKSAKITYEQMQEMRHKLVIKDNSNVRTKFSQNKDLYSTTLIYSMWKEYLNEVRSFWDKNNVPVLHVHCSGHAYLSDLKKFEEAIKPEYIIPIHTFYPEKYTEFLRSKIRRVKDKQTVEI